MYKFTRHTRDSGIAKSSAISKGFWFGALATVVGFAGVVAKINPGRPMGSTVTTSTSASSLGGGYNVTGPTLSAPPSSGGTPQQQSITSQPSAPAPVAASGAS